MRTNYSTLIFLVAVYFCNGCSTTEQRTDSNIPKTRVGSAPIPYRTADQTIKDFLCWYNDNYRKLSKIQLVNNSPPTGDDTKYYSVNFKGTEQWLKMFHESGFVSDEFLSRWRAYFKDSEKAFQRDPVSDGPPAGFAYDFIYNSQEDFPLNADIQNAMVTQYSVSGDKFTMVLDVPNYGTVSKILVKSADGNWLLAE